MASQIYVNAVTLSDAAEWNKWDTAAYCALTGTAGTNTITATGPANLGLVATNPILWFIPANTNTGATTLNITPSGGAALGAKNVISGGVACVGGEIIANSPVAVVYDGTQYYILNNGSREGTWTPADGSGAALSFTLNGTPWYSKRGRVVTYGANITYPATADGSGASITGLPFTVANNSSAQTGFVGFSNEATLIRAIPIANTITIVPYTAAGGQLTNASLSTDTFSIGGSYIV